MKTTKKIIIATVSLILILSLSVLSVYCVSTAAEAAEAGTAGVENFEEGIFKLIYSAVVENSDKLFSALAFIGMLTVAFAYKKGFLPLAEKSLSSLSSSLSKLREEFKSENEVGESLLSRLEAAINCAEEMMEKLDIKLSELAEKLEPQEC